MTGKVTTAIFPVAGFGTRVLPATKSFPKEMLPVVERPLIHYAVAEAIEATWTEEVFPLQGDKLGGWPYWVQGPELPQCPECSETMALVFQLDSEDNVPHMFGDAGIGHILQCPDHPEQLSWGWACY